jgi:hypothetical protein
LCANVKLLIILHAYSWAIKVIDVFVAILAAGTLCFKRYTLWALRTLALNASKQTLLITPQFFWALAMANLRIERGKKLIMLF